nr:MAG TPA: tail protein [Caudoviricetes sp.]
MEKLIYKNQLGESVEISATPPFLLERKEGFGAIKNKIGTSNSYGQDGETVVNESLEKRDMSIEGNILARSREELLRLRRITRILRAYKLKLKVIKLKCQS